MRKVFSEVALNTNLCSIFSLNKLGMFKVINQIEFSKRFPANGECYEYLIGQKWVRLHPARPCGVVQGADAVPPPLPAMPL